MEAAAQGTARPSTIGQRLVLRELLAYVVAALRFALAFVGWLVGGLQSYPRSSPWLITHGVNALVLIVGSTSSCGRDPGIERL